MFQVATLSWTDPQGQTLDTFRTTLASVCEDLSETGFQTDLLLCAGHSVGPLREQLVGQTPVAQRVLEASRDVPVLFEVKARDDWYPWALASREGGIQRIAVVREGQLVVKHGDMGGIVELVDRLSHGEGILALDRGINTVLLICGENNALDPTSNSSPFRRGLPEGLVRALQSGWVVLNPAHGAYWPQVNEMGFAKVGPHPASGRDHDPTMLALVNRPGLYPNGTKPPAAFTYANNMIARVEARTAEYASVVFLRGETRRLRSLHSAQDAGRWRLAFHRIPLTRLVGS